MVGFNDAVTPITVQTLLRWLGIPPSDDDETVVIKQVWLEHYDVLEYAPQPQPDSKPLESSSILTKGVYDCFMQGEYALYAYRSHEMWLELGGDSRLYQRPERADTNAENESLDTSSSCGYIQGASRDQN